jgi:hypothetical protein
LHIKTGIIGTNTISDDSYYTIQNGVVRNFGYVAGTMAAVISRDPNEHLVIRVGKDAYCIPDATTMIALYNVRPGHMKHVLANKGPLPNRKQANANVDMQEPYTDDSHVYDDLPIYYDDLLEMADAKKRFHFIPVLGASQRAVPFICFSTGGSK